MFGRFSVWSSEYYIEISNKLHPNPYQIIVLQDADASAAETVSVNGKRFDERNKIKEDREESTPFLGKPRNLMSHKCRSLRKQTLCTYGLYTALFVCLLRSSCISYTSVKTSSRAMYIITAHSVYFLTSLSATLSYRVVSDCCSVALTK
jgi:hypothetical protein